MQDFQLDAYDYILPQELIASYPASPRESAKLLVYDSKTNNITHTDFYHFYDFIPKDTLFVLNDTKVIKARMFGYKQNSDETQGGKVEVLYHRHLKQDLFLVQIRGRVKVGSQITLTPNFKLEVKALLDNGFREVIFYLNHTPASLSDVLEQIQEIGHIPLPPYIKRSDEILDESQYQSVFAKNLGAVAAPTASLHFSDITYLKEHFSHCFVTLNVGAGTFLSVETQDIRLHQIHTESFSLSQESWKKIQDSSQVLCIGTTTTRVVEYLHRNPPNPTSNPISGECDLFLHPFNRPQKVKMLLTNFHLPKSTLIMLVSAFIGRQKCLELYQEAILKNYRFYSYGDGMLIL